jgi:hypothetical protein
MAGRTSSAPAVHVRAYGRRGPSGRVGVDDHDRSFPGGAPAASRQRIDHITGSVGDGRVNRPDDVRNAK